MMSYEMHARCFEDNDCVFLESGLLKVPVCSDAISIWQDLNLIEPCKPSIALEVLLNLWCILVKWPSSRLPFPFPLFPFSN